MGTDIHAQVQVRRETGWEWVGHQGPVYKDMQARYSGHTWSILTDRNYHLFSLLAGVRGEPCDYNHDVGTEPIAKDRGWPADISALGLYEGYPVNGKDYDFGDWGFSWVTLDELDRFPWNEDDREGCRDFLEKVMPWLRTLACGAVGDKAGVRIVFGFDS